MKTEIKRPCAPAHPKQPWSIMDVTQHKGLYGELLFLEQVAHCPVLPGP